MPFGGGFGLDDRPFRPNRLLDFDDNPSMMGIGGHRGRGGRGGSRGHMRGRQGRFQHDRHYMAHNNRRLATNMLGRKNSSSSGQQDQGDYNSTDPLLMQCTPSASSTAATATSQCTFVTKLDINGNTVRVCEEPNCFQLHHNKNTQSQQNGNMNYHLNPLSSSTALTPPPEYQSGPPSPNVHQQHHPSSRHHLPLTQTNNLKGDWNHVSKENRRTTQEHVDQFGKLYSCKSVTNTVLLMLAVVFFAIFLTLLILLA